MPEHIHIMRLTKTCHAFPSQWEGRLDTGQDIYIRYRHGEFGVGIGWTGDEAVDNTVYRPLAQSDPGFISTANMLITIINITDAYIEPTPGLVVDDPYGDMPGETWRREVLGNA